MYSVAQGLLQGATFSSPIGSRVLMVKNFFFWFAPTPVEHQDESENKTKC